MYTVDRLLLLVYCRVKVLRWFPVLGIPLGIGFSMNVISPTRVDVVRIASDLHMYRLKRVTCSLVKLSEEDWVVVSLLILVSFLLSSLQFNFVLIRPYAIGRGFYRNERREMDIKWLNFRCGVVDRSVPSEMAVVVVKLL